MNTGDNLETIRRLLIFFLLFTGILTGAITPSGVFASGSENPAVIAAGEELATFDEDETVSFDSQTATDAPAILHADHYRPPAYFPDRSNRSVTSHTWMRAIPFAALFILLLATTRLFRKRRSKPILVENPTTLKKIAGIGIAVLLTVSITGGISLAQRGFSGQGGFPARGGFPGQGGFPKSSISYPVKDIVASLLGEDREIFQKSIGLTTDAKQMLKEKFWWEPQEDSIKAYYSKTEDGAVDAYAFVLSDILARCGGLHKYCIKVSSKGQVEGVKIVELNCPKSFGINNDWFLNQFEKMDATNADTIRVDAVSRATLSANLTYNVVRRALVLFDLSNGKADA